MLYRVIFCKQKTAYEMRISHWSSDVCSADLKRGIQSCLDACSQSAHRRISYRLVREVFEPAALADNGVRHAVAHIELAAHLRVFTYGETRANKGAGSFVCHHDFNPLDGFRLEGMRTH